MSLTLATAALLRAVPADNTVSPGVLGFVVVVASGGGLVVVVGFSVVVVTLPTPVATPLA